MGQEDVMVIPLLVGLALTLSSDPGQSPSSPAPVSRSEPAATRLFFGPTARSLEPGDVSLNAYEIMLPSVQFGVTDRFSIGAGAPLIVGDVPFWVTVGVVQFLNVGEDTFGVAYGVVTKGSADSAVSVGGGYAYETFAGGKSAVVMLGSEHRVARRVALLTENYIFRDGALVIGGVRMSRRHFSADLGVATLLIDGERVALPITNLVWRF
jgi:hypothetical protein